MTGEQIKNVLEDAINFYLDPAGSWGAYPRASGLRYNVNEALPFGSRVSALEINPKLEGTWAPIDMSGIYIVVTNNFIATPRDGYFEFGKIPEEKKVDTYVEYAQSFIEYSESVGILEPVPEDRASTQEWSSELPPVRVCGAYGCLTSNKYTDRVKAKPENTFMNQVWEVMADGKVMSPFTNKCVSVDDDFFVVVADCDAVTSLVFYDESDGTMGLFDYPTRRFGARGPRSGGNKVKLVPIDPYDLGQTWTLHYL